MMRVSSTQHLVAPRVRAKSRLAGVAAIVCLLLIGVTSYDAIHVHRSDPLGNEPLAPHHCLLCLAGHLPLTVQAGVSLPAIAFSRPSALTPLETGSYDLLRRFSLDIRPPPQA